MENDSHRQDVVKVRGSDRLFVQAELGKMSSSDTAPFFQGAKETSLAAETDGVEEMPCTASAGLSWEVAMNSPTSHGKLKPTACVLCLALTPERWEAPIPLS